MVGADKKIGLRRLCGWKHGVLIYISGCVASMTAGPAAATPRTTGSHAGR